jgi:hypothetical protein
MFRFTMRDILWLTLAVALGISWQGERSHGKKLARQYARLCCEVKWCPRDMHIVFDESGDFKLEYKPNASRLASSARE